MALADRFTRITHARAAAAIIAAGAAPPERADRYSTYRHYAGGSVHGPERWGLIDRIENVSAVDVFHTRSGAAHAARELNAGRSIIERHRPIGTRVQPRRMSWPPDSPAPIGRASAALA